MRFVVPFLFLVAACRALLAETMIFLVRCYQYTLSPIVGQQCRFQPTCSNYFIGAVRKYGPISGAVRGAWRILRCNPFCRSGFDPP
ncbi:membrane protein insertion efficiency factor YidD [Blastopirellula marina]|uniref:Putative membrane protein insertion efficiency factor n=1 Tax=Blastopirellula marina TaxID=124 RepID=A0A2S8GLD5_9BACT|nr:membrane protein insertion efficiency factor YidD [Blastopirellula marina]PQO45238.1 membrane protein insertion efficiency factor YidD [Blastopirellula marina]